MMLSNLNASWQYLKQNRLFALLNIAGLVIGITSALFIFIYVDHERSYDRFHRDYQNIYRVLGIDSSQGVTSSMVGITMPPLGPAMEESIAGVEESVRVRTQGKSYITIDDRKYDAEFAVFTEDAFFDVFGFTLQQRQPGVLLDKPHSAVLTQQFAEKIYGTADVLGKTFVFNNQIVEVAGVLDNPPGESHMRLDMLVSLNFLAPEDQGAEQLQNFLENWGLISMVTYVRLEEGFTEQQVEEDLTALLVERSGIKTFSATLQPLADAHLGSSEVIFDNFNADKGDAQKVFMLGSIAVFLLLIAAFNFMNLTTARASLRAKEVGLRKTVGATRGQLMMQFLQESLTFVCLAAAFGMALTYVLEPVVSLPLDQRLVDYLFTHREAMWSVAMGLLALGLLAGSYPAFVLSAFAPALVLKGKFANSARGLWLRRLLVVLQFALSIAVIIGMLVVQRQLDYMHDKDPGFAREGILTLELNDPALQQNYEVLKNRLLTVPQVISVTSSSNMPGQTFARNSITPEGSGEDDFFMVSAMVVDSQYLDTLSMRLVAGRNYSLDYPTDAQESLVLNESAVKVLGWTNDEAVGRHLNQGNGQRMVIGVVQDFHFADMRHQIEPVILLYREGGTRLMSIRIDGTAVDAAIERIGEVWREVNPAFPFYYTFFADEYNKLFSDEEEFSSLLHQFTFVAIIIACLGLYGLASFSAEQKTKEISVRKVLGASNGSLLQLVTREYAVLMLCANVLAWALAWAVMQRWLSGFAYRTELPLASFALATLGTTVVALLTIGRVLFKVLQTRLAETLRYE